MPGMVLRVSVIRAPVPSTAATNAAVAVATPEIRPRRLSAVRSAARRDLAGPETTATAVPGTVRSPSEARASKATPESTAAKTWAATSRPANVPSARATMFPSDLVLSGTHA